MLAIHLQMTGRLLSLLAIIVGGVLFAAQLPTRFDISPFPGSALHVKLHFGVRFAGDYIVEVVMPKAGNELDPGAETVPCEFSFIISKNDVVVHSQNVDAMNRRVSLAGRILNNTEPAMPSTSGTATTPPPSRAARVQLLQSAGRA